MERLDFCLLHQPLFRPFRGVRGDGVSVLEPALRLRRSASHQGVVVGVDAPVRGVPLPEVRAVRLWLRPIHHCEDPPFDEDTRDAAENVLSCELIEDVELEDVRRLCS